MIFEKISSKPWTLPLSILMWLNILVIESSSKSTSNLSSASGNLSTSVWLAKSWLPVITEANLLMFFVIACFTVKFL